MSSSIVFLFFSHLGMEMGQFPPFPPDMLMGPPPPGVFGGHPLGRGGGQFSRGGMRGGKVWTDFYKPYLIGNT